MTRFEELLKRYTDRIANEAELEELFILIQSGEYDDEIDDDIRHTLESEFSGYGREENSLKKEAFDWIAKKHGFDQQHKVVRMNPKIWMAAAASIILLGLIGVWAFMYTDFLNQPPTIVQNETTKYTGKNFIHLPDGTTVTLNEGSELSYSFSKNNRLVSLKGEAYFDVTHDPTKPFIVQTGKISTRVLGTAFNIKAYTRDVQVTVTRGKVEVGNTNQVYGILRPNERIAVNSDTDEFVKSNLDAENSISWRNDFLILDNITMGEAARLISERYDVKILFESPAVKKCSIDAKFFEGEELEDVMTMLSTAVNFTYTINKENKLVISGKGCD